MIPRIEAGRERSKALGYFASRLVANLMAREARPRRGDHLFTGERSLGDLHEPKPVIRRIHPGGSASVLRDHRFEVEVQPRPGRGPRRVDQPVPPDEYLVA